MGEHLAATCTGCNGTGFSGGTFPRVPPNGSFASKYLANNGPLNSYCPNNFIRTMGTELTPDGRELSNEFMPWEVFGEMTGDELAGLFSTLQTFPFLETSSGYVTFYSIHCTRIITLRIYTSLKKIIKNSGDYLCLIVTRSFFAWGASYVRKTEECILKSKPIHRYDLILLTDQATDISSIEKWFKNVIRISFESSGLTRKAELTDHLPQNYDGFLLLDSDTIVLEDIHLGFEKAAKHGIAATPAYPYSLDAFFGFEEIMKREQVP